MLKLCVSCVFTTLLALTVALAGCIASVQAVEKKVQHVFLIVLENQSYEATFGRNSAARDLSRTLTKQGALLPNYYGIGHWSLDNYIAMISGQAPNKETQADCEIYSEFQLSAPALDAHGQALGVG